MKELELIEIKREISELNTKFDELSKSIGKKVREQQKSAEGRGNKNPLAYMAGALVGGVLMGYLLGRGKS
ncbi:MAG: hypothetical protein MPEBLZ_00862 [Candidatus Methanoperedens nitroreducens]|uniref:Uncharacterized protein n=1 Tax=Candidatus Methanoperedens nitratireducens TaxID=1392998 RepID=A0A0P7ZKH3_9EURY|nr:hypothetical protein [Candidatus Methanoperedens sp. BLZ2]KAB2945156.1 MAG: hypothetical protein F9K14_12170 [Candidatus Methanoperedens sp.]KPQ44550.1 MAG: hypothetical protein MPEBLZ_00862 [Candidatus Methanoperedens sp. BLZ1]MBZ0173655.1 hypothetical protein [Candidatus Methanoperedens nitroreducens]CAG1007201.1 hypothetical protein METP2_03841 [Methanosarcinales archaeon]MCX9077366.1 hypothetical protein [Candidatus Methanoperedens sp.]